MEKVYFPCWVQLDNFLLKQIQKPYIDINKPLLGVKHTKLHIKNNKSRQLKL